MSLSILLLAGAIAPSAAEPSVSRADDPPASLFPQGYLDHRALGEALRSLAERHPEAVRLSSLAKTPEGRDVWLVALGRARAEDETPPPALLLVANLEADHLVGSQVALGLVRRLVESEDPQVSKLLNEHTIYVVPRLAPDGAERFLGAPSQAVRTNLRPVDEDRDRATDEDGPDDLDGDGLVTTMRLEDQEAALAPDPKEPRILRPAKAAEGERAVYSVYPEGRDDDGDGRWNEDPVGGVNLNRNWPHDWSEYDDQAGRGQVSEPAVRALIQFCYDHPEIAIVWTFALHDDLRETPEKRDTPFDEADLPRFIALAEAYQAALKPTTVEDAAAREETETQDEDENEESDEADEREAPKPAEAEFAPLLNTSSLGATRDGSMSAWAYQQFGALAFSSSLWPEPTLAKPAEGEPALPDEPERRWLYWNDHVMDGRAFVEFQEVELPDFGAVEVGGWKPGVRINPPIEEVDPIAEAHLRFLTDLAGRFARLELADAAVESRGGGIFEVSARVANTGRLPTALAQGVKTRQAKPVLVKLEVGDGALLAGPPLTRIDSLEGSGGSRSFRWLVQAGPEAEAVRIEAHCPRAGRASATLELED